MHFRDFLINIYIHICILCIQSKISLLTIPNGFVYSSHRSAKTTIEIRKITSAVQCYHRTRNALLPLYYNYIYNVILLPLAFSDKSLK